MVEIRQTAVVKSDGILEIKDPKLKVGEKVEIVIRSFLPELPTGALPVLPMGAELKLYNKKVFQGPVVARIKLKAPLFMRKAKLGILGCEPVRVTVFIQVPEVGTPEQEALRLRVPQVTVHPQEGIIEVSANSLNQALTLTSLRLEPERKSIGGKVYNYCAFEDRSLDELRATVDLMARKLTDLFEQYSALPGGRKPFVNQQSPTQLRELFTDPRLELFYEPPKTIGVLAPDVSISSQWKYSGLLTFDPSIAGAKPNVRLLTYTDPLFQKAVEAAEIDLAALAKQGSQR